LIGNRFGRLLVQAELAVRSNDRRIRYHCLCDCGNEYDVSGTQLRTGHVLSCGCYQKEVVRNLNLSHNKSNTPTYNSWCSMKSRCYNENNNKYKDYGGRGVIVCDRWITSFENFLKDMGEKPIGTTLDCKDNDGNYEPSNCKWSTSVEQANNRRKRSVYLRNEDGTFVRNEDGKSSLHP
jgi:hypothetical protein